MASLLRPEVPGVTSIGNILAQATQSAAIQSRNILSTAASIARDRQRAGERAADAMVQRRLEAFQERQFEQRRMVENRRLEFESQRLQHDETRLGFAEDANRRAEEHHPLDLSLKRAAVNDAPLRTALLGANVTGAHLDNQAQAANNLILPQLTEAAKSKAEADIGRYEEEARIYGDQEDLLGHLDNIALSYDGTNIGKKETYELLENLKSEYAPGGVLDTARGRAMFNGTVKSLDFPEKFEQALIIPDATTAPLTPGGSRTIQQKLPDGSFISTTERSPEASSTGVSGLTSSQRMAHESRVNRLEEKKASLQRRAEEEIANLKALRSKSDTSSKRAEEITREIGGKIEEIERIERKFRADLQDEIERVEKEAEAAASPIDMTLFGGGQPAGTPAASPAATFSTPEDFLGN